MIPKKYFPELLSRQGEVNAWSLTFLAAVGIYFLTMRTVVPGWAWFLVGILAFSAISISLGNWMDRNTSIELTPHAVTYKNGIRTVEIAWNKISEIKVLPARWGKTVQIVGEDVFFSFNTYGEMKFRDEVKSKTGFLEGEEILGFILNQTGLTGQEDIKSGKILYKRSE